jgi:dTDP-4-dehydrorhamnose 3,5-epimerase/CDP-3, 6-dideoxy-D-glycero-D-glycero-4-hexulose-5-epimerase
MDVVEEPLPGVYRIRLRELADARGRFVKTYSHSTFLAAGIAFDFREEYFSVSKKNVVRGMHFQIPPHDHDKVVYCAVGAVEDVLLDIRSGPEYGRVYSIVLSSDQPEVLFIAKGVAHGFRSLTDDSLMVYKTSTEYAPQHDRGILWNSFGHDWRISDPILSDRDRCHPAIGEFVSPF